MDRAYIHPDVPPMFWAQFDGLWSGPLDTMGQLILSTKRIGHLAEDVSFWGDTTEDYRSVMGCLFVDTVQNAMGVFALLSLGLVDQANIMWRSCHESSTIALYIAQNPKVASTYVEYGEIDRAKLARTLFNSNHPDAPSEVELKAIEERHDKALASIIGMHGERNKGRPYAWAGKGTFREIEYEAFAEHESNLHGEYQHASWLVHANPGRRSVHTNENVRFLGPALEELTSPIDYTGLSLLNAVHAIIWHIIEDDDHGTWPDEDFLGKVMDNLLEVMVYHNAASANAWAVDPAIRCEVCDGYNAELTPPDGIPEKDMPPVCSCRDSGQ